MLLAQLRGKSQVTVLGPAGVGKTTVAVAAARAFEADCPDGVRFVDLSTIDDPTLLPSALVAALGLRGDMGDALTAVVDHLRQRSMARRAGQLRAYPAGRHDLCSQARSSAGEGPGSWPPAGNRWACPPRM